MVDVNQEPDPLRDDRQMALMWPGVQPGQGNAPTACLAQRRPGLTVVRADPDQEAVSAALGAARGQEVMAGSRTARQLIETSTS